MSSAFSRVTAHILSTRMGKLTSCLILHFQSLLLIKQVLHQSLALKSVDIKQTVADVEIELMLIDLLESSKAIGLCPMGI